MRNNICSVIRKMNKVWIIFVTSIYVKNKKDKQKKEKQNLFFNRIVYLCTKES